MHSKSAPRRRHGDELKAQVLAQCDAPGASVAAVAQIPMLVDAMERHGHLDLDPVIKS